MTPSDGSVRCCEVVALTSCVLVEIMILPYSRLNIKKCNYYAGYPIGRDVSWGDPDLDKYVMRKYNAAKLLQTNTSEHIALPYYGSDDS